LETNIGKNAMDRAIDNYMRRLALDRSNEGFFWFAGHAVHISGENYLLPIDVDTRDNLAVRHSSVSVRYLTESFDARARNKVNIVVLDACRDNPFRNMSGETRSLTRGLSVVQDHQLPPDLLIIFSTAPHDVAFDGAGKRNSPFAEAFLQSMDSNDDITIMVRGITRETLRLTDNRQRPFTSGSIIGLDFYSLNPLRSQPTASAPPPAAQPAPAAAAPAARPATPPPAQPVPAPAQPAPAPATVQPAATPAARPPERPVPTDMVRINGGSFQMGSPSNEAGRRDNESPQRQVTVGSFSMGRTQVTQAQWEAVMGNNPSRFKGPNLPVESVTWFDAVEYCNRLSQREGLTPAYTISDRTPATGHPITGATVTWNRSANGYRLPTEAEWEYACRAGTTTAWNTGATISDNTGWYSANSNSKTQEVGKKPANAWGLHDMHGNVWEWCWDLFGMYPSAHPDPIGAVFGSYRVERGGSWYDVAQSTRSAIRLSRGPDGRYYSIGFRLVRP
jgi:formylglycine-generating enzyme required for sulfatase activity